MANEFDLEKAKRGEPIEYRPVEVWQSCHFVGTSKRGAIVIENAAGNLVDVGNGSFSLRMRPKGPVTMWVQLCWNGALPIICTDPYPTKDEAIRAAEGWKKVGEPQPVLVPDES